jgi:acyl transferase domain-containing protein/2-polyprenyl-3-methyl-5-hydroxy-6-metoxy-1,4-benzoquinol methylase
MPPHGPARASVNSFGYGGTNAHVILEKWDPKGRPKNLRNTVGTVNQTRCCDRLDTDGRNPHLLVLSAKTEQSLLSAAEDLQKWVSRNRNNFHISDLSNTMLRRRSKFKWRTSFLATSSENILSALHSDKICKNIRAASPTVELGFLFTGQGAQWAGMGRDIFSIQPAFRKSILKSELILRDLGAPWNLTREMFSESTTSRINQSMFSQPATTALQIALVDLLGTLGIRPSAVIGHSSGEIAAAYGAGIISQETALKVAYFRGFISSANGAMLTVGAGEDDILRHINESGLQQDAITIACVNSSVNTTVSGNEHAILKLKQLLDRQSIFNRKLNVSTAYHSYHVAHAAHNYFASLGKIEDRLSEKGISFISSVTAEEKRSGFGAAYWVENLVSKVRFYETLQEYCRIRHESTNGDFRQLLHILIEIGPHSSLAAPTRQTLSSKSGFYHNSYYATMARNQSTIERLLSLAGGLFENGVPINFGMVDSLNSEPEEKYTIQDLPPYAWDHSKQYWHESRLSKDHRLRKHPYHDLLGVRTAESNSLQPRWRFIVGINDLPWLEEHVIDSVVIFPGAAYLCMTIEAVRQLVEEGGPSVTSPAAFMISLKDISFPKALIVPPAPSKVEVNLNLSTRYIAENEPLKRRYDFVVTALSDDRGWQEYCRGTIETHPILLGDIDNAFLPKEIYTTTREVIEKEMSSWASKASTSQEMYGQLQSSGNSYGPHFAAIQTLQGSSNSQNVAQVEIPDIASTMPSNHMQSNIIHPTTLDAFMHPSLVLYTQQYGQGSVLPVSIDELTIMTSIEKRPGKCLFLSTTLAREGPRAALATILAFDADGQDSLHPAVYISGLRLRGLGGHAAGVASRDVRNISYTLEWGPDPNFLAASFIRSQPLLGLHASQKTKIGILNQVASIYIERCLTMVKTRGVKIREGHHLALFSWMERHSASPLNDHLDDNDRQTIDKVVEQANYQGVEGEMLSLIGSNLTAILSGEVNPLQVMMSDDLLFKYYTTDSCALCYTHMNRYLKQLMFQNPNMEILEVGAGTAGATSAIFEALDTDGRIGMKRYDFTDVSASFFERAQALLQQWTNNIKFKSLDLDLDPIEQGFIPGSYDLVVASNVIHATKSIEGSLDKIHKLLKPGGRLLLIEVTQPQVFINLIFGTLPGWWQGKLQQHLP